MCFNRISLNSVGNVKILATYNTDHNTRRIAVYPDSLCHSASSIKFLSETHLNKAAVRKVLELKGNKLSQFLGLGPSFLQFFLKFVHAYCLCDSTPSYFE